MFTISNTEIFFMIIIPVIYYYLINRSLYLNKKEIYKSNNKLIKALKYIVVHPMTIIISVMYSIFSVMSIQFLIRHSYKIALIFNDMQKLSKYINQTEGILSNVDKLGMITIFILNVVISIMLLYLSNRNKNDYSKLINGLTYLIISISIFSVFLLSVGYIPLTLLVFKLGFVLNIFNIYGSIFNILTQVIITVINIFHKNQVTRLGKL